MTLISPTIYQALEWRSIGPYRGGRVLTVAGDPVNPAVFYFGSCGGGVWKTDDAGTYWHNISDGYFSTGAVGAIAVSSSDPNVVYVGMGEACIRGNISHGDGVYRSTDGGKTWVHLGLEDTRHISRIRIHPTNPDLVYVAALGHVFGPNSERGIYRSSDGGQSWEQVLYKSDNAGAADLSMDTSNPRILYAAIYEARRYPWSLVSGGPDSGIYKSTDGGTTWEDLSNNHGLPKGVIGRIGVAASPAKAGRVWALIEAEDGALFRSDDSGATWQRTCDQRQLRSRPFYYTHVIPDPQNAETVYVLASRNWKSTDGGHTFTRFSTPHEDNHDMWIDPKNTQRRIHANDEGASISWNGGESWTRLDNQPTAQMYHVTTDTQFPYRVYGAQQDCSTISVPSRSRTGAIGQTEWYTVGGDEAGYIAVHPNDPNIVYSAHSGSGPFTRYDHRTGQGRDITVWPEHSSGTGAKDLKYRFQWTFPIVISPHDPGVVYMAGNHIFRTIDEGASWEIISPDLTRNDVTKQQASGGPITKDATAVEYYCTVFAFVESPHEPGVFMAGSDDGLVHLSRNNGETWNDITPPDLPEWTLISIIEPSPHDAATFYIAATRYKMDDTRPCLYKTKDYGKHWTKIINGIPDNDFTRVIREDPGRRGLLYAGTETGVYVSFDDGSVWQPLQLNLPVVPIHDLVVKDSDLVAATHGRSFWILDDLTPLRQIAAGLVDSPSYLFQPRPTYRFPVRRGFWAGGLNGRNYERGDGPLVFTYNQSIGPNGQTVRRMLDAGDDLDDGVMVFYYLKDKPEGDVTVDFLDGDGEVIRQFRSSSEDTKERPSAREDLRVPKEPGMNRFTWDMRYPGAHRISGDESTTGFGSTIAGPMVLPGMYEVQLNVNGEISAQRFEIRMDPRITSTQGDLKAQFDLLIQIRNKLSETHDSINKLRSIRKKLDSCLRQVEDLNTGRLESTGIPRRRPTTLIARIAELTINELVAVEETLTNIPISDAGQASTGSQAVGPQSGLSQQAKLNAKLASLNVVVAKSDDRPTQQSYAVFDELSKRVDQQLRKLKTIFDKDVKEFNERWTKHPELRHPL